MATGRPTKFTQKLAETICKRIAQGESLRTIVKDDDMPCAATVFTWLLDPAKKDFLEQYETARNVQAELMFEELLEIADNGEHDELERTTSDGDTYTVPNTEYMQRSRLRVDTRKWYLSKVLPKKFGDKIAHVGPNDGPIQVEGVEIVVRRKK
ncbi:MAG: terminase small subunit protein [Alphaproteobacteria bacterium]|nr:terminase small subunit protein [Alphaproteobacteria bacterium]MCW5741608.1 terminase small subunit protein [Alphaproteobacteria bacterium]